MTAAARAALCAAAHEAAVERLEVLERVNAAIVEGEEPDELDAARLAGPACGGCDDCTVREVLDAAFERLLELAEIDPAKP